MLFCQNSPKNSFFYEILYSTEKNIISMQLTHRRQQPPTPNAWSWTCKCKKIFKEHEKTAAASHRKNCTTMQEETTSTN
jgi:hypothetical protein